MDYISSDLKVNETILTCMGNTFISIENYLSILTYEKEMIKIKTKHKIITIIGGDLGIKYIIDDEIGVVGTIKSIEYSD